MPKTSNQQESKAADPVIETQPAIDEEPLHTLLIEDVKYKTRFTRKFLNRVKFEPKDPKKVVSFIPGTIKKIYVSKGKRVKEGDKLLDLEAMKMMNTIFCPHNGTIADIFVKEGDLVPKNFLLAQYK